MTYDVLVVGGGPGGLFAAWRLAESGHHVLLCEEHDAIGTPVHCTGVMAADCFDEFALPRETILNPLASVRFVSPSDLQLSYASAAPQAVVIDRGEFDSRLASRAVAAGAELRLNARVSDVEPRADCVRATVARETVTARLVVLACGASYMLQRHLGLGLPKAYLLTAQRELPATSLREVEIHFGKRIAPSGFAWAVPVQRPDGPYVRVGVMAARGPASWYSTMLDRIAGRWGVDVQRRDTPRLKFLPLRSIQRTYANRLLVVGDAAGMVKPTTGGGIYYSILSAALAADVAADALATDRLTAGTLREYEVRWRRRLAGEFRAQWALRHIAQRMSDRQIDGLFELALTDGVMPIVHRTANFNHHRKLIQALFRHGPARRIFWPARS